MGQMVSCMYIKDVDWSTYEAPNSASRVWKFVSRAKKVVTLKLKSYQWL